MCVRCFVCGRVIPCSVNSVGATFKYKVTDNDGVSHLRTVAQSPSSKMLELPYSLVGLSRISTMVEELAVGLPLNQSVHYQRWIVIIPNSAVVVVPWPVAQPDQWKLLLYVTPSSRMVWIVSALFGVMLTLVLVVTLLECRERKADQRESLQNAHLFSFDAL